MPPDDQLFEETPEGTPTPEKGAEEKPEGAEGGQLDQMKEMLEQAVSGGQATQEQIQQLTTALTVVAQRQQTPQVPMPEPNPNERFRQLYEDPDGYINKQVQAGVLAGLQKLGPHLKVQAEQMRDALLFEQRAQVEKDYGEGAWDADFKEDFEKVMASLPLEMQSSREHVDSTMSAIIGNMVRDPERRDKLQERGAEVKKRRETPMPSMMSGHRATPRGQTLNPTEKDFLASLARSGIELDSKDYVSAREKGRSESDWTPPVKPS